MHQVRKRCAEGNQKTSKDSSLAYIKPIIKSMKDDQMEHKFFMMSSAYNTYRGPVINWMLEVCAHFKLHITTSHAAISYLDRLQPGENSSRHEWQMIAIACIYVAAKYNESELDVPPLCHFEDIVHHSIPNESMLTFELWILRRLQWLLNVRSPVAFLCSYQAAGVCVPEIMEDIFFSKATALASACMIDVRFKSYKASDVAIGILFVIRQCMGMVPTWPDKLCELTECDPRVRVDDAKLPNLLVGLHALAVQHSILPSEPAVPANTPTMSPIGTSTGNSGTPASATVPVSATKAVDESQISGSTETEASMDTDTELSFLCGLSTSGQACDPLYVSHHELRSNGKTEVKSIKRTTPVSVSSARFSPEFMMGEQATFSS